MPLKLSCIARWGERIKTSQNEYCKLLQQSPEGCSASDIVEKLASNVVDIGKKCSTASSPG